MLADVIFLYFCNEVFLFIFVSTYVPSKYLWQSLSQILRYDSQFTTRWVFLFLYQPLISEASHACLSYSVPSTHWTIDANTFNLSRNECLSYQLLCFVPFYDSFLSKQFSSSRFSKTFIKILKRWDTGGIMISAVDFMARNAMRLLRIFKTLLYSWAKDTVTAEWTVIIIVYPTGLKLHARYTKSF